MVIRAELTRALVIFGFLAAVSAEAESVPANIHIEDNGGDHAASLVTGSFESGPFISTLEQTFTVGPDADVLSFEFTFDTQPDATGSGTGFNDAFAVTIESGTDVFVLLAVDDVGGAVVDPFASAPGTMTLTSGAVLDHRLSIDFSLLVGETVTILFEIFNEDDQKISTALVDKLMLVDIGGSSLAAPANGDFESLGGSLDGWSTAGVSAQTPVPEPGALLLLGTGIGGLFVLRTRPRCRHSRPQDI